MINMIDTSVEAYQETLDRYSTDPVHQMRLINFRLDWLIRIYSQSKTKDERHANKLLIEEYVELFSRVYYRKQLLNTDNPVR
jgi:hypothetical protein